ncbi:MAG: Uma2 family endonuclease [Pseudomonadota bacterium]|nr:Uma2 family endonuclease [Pseudomonadota bacterium]
MSVDEFLAWAEGRPGRYELYAGTVYAMAPERAGHAKVKFATQQALAAAIRRARLPCHMLPDGMTVRVDRDTAHEPDALVYCGEELPDAAVEVPYPVLVVEVLSPTTRHIDASAKLAGYFRIPTVEHYLIVDPGQRLVIHHARGSGPVLATRFASEGAIRFDPPGFEINIADLYPDSCAAT